MRPLRIKRANPTRRWLLAMGAVAGVMALVVAAMGPGRVSYGAGAGTSHYPDKPVTIIVTFPPGGGTDLLARKLGARLEQSVGVPVVVENLPGASGNIGARKVARAKADGYTLLMVNSSFAINPGVYPDPGFSPANDLQAVINVAWVPSVLVARTQHGPQSLPELVTQASDNTVALGTCGNGTPQHLAMQILHENSGANFQHIPYRGCGPAIADVLAGVVPVGMVTLSGAMPHIQSGALRPLAVIASDRTALLPDVQTVAEQGYPGYALNQWHGLLAPAGTPEEILDFLSATLQDIVDSDSLRAELQSLGYETAKQSRAEFQTLVLDDMERFGELTDRMGLSAD